ncbi:MAG: DUF2231 domain-containing protein [Fulvivirga sp.]
MKIQFIILSFFIYSFSYPLQAQQEENNNDTATTHREVEGEQHDHNGHATKVDNRPLYNHPEKVTADFEDFPNLHPLFVHFPVALLPFAAFFQLIGLFVFKRALSWVVLTLVVFGFIGGYIAATLVHPNVGELPQHAQEVYDTHATYATWTLWLSGIAILLKAGSHFFLKRKIWAEVFVALVLLGSAYTVSIAGHHGSQLVFIEGLGPQGKYLESGEHAH